MPALTLGKGTAISSLCICLVLLNRCHRFQTQHSAISRRSTYFPVTFCLHHEYCFSMGPLLFCLQSKYQKQKKRQQGSPGLLVFLFAYMCVLYVKPSHWHTLSNFSRLILRSELTSIDHLCWIKTVFNFICNFVCNFLHLYTIEKELCY